MENTEKRKKAVKKSATAKRVSPKVKQHLCTECGFATATSFNLSRHQRIHAGERPFECGECGAKFNNQSHLKEHELRHTKKRKPLKCPHCEYTCVKKSGMEDHEKTHSREGLLKCKWCDFVTVQRSNLRRHEERHHVDNSDEEIPEFQCVECQKCFLTENQLKRHQETHTNIRPFTCDQCDKSFKRNSQLKEHKNCHSIDALLKCTQCKYETRKKSDLTRHLKTHSGDRPFRCLESGCFYAAKELRFLKNHIKMYHSGNPTRVTRSKKKPRLVVKVYTKKPSAIDESIDYKNSIEGILNSCYVKLHRLSPEEIALHTHVDSSERRFKCMECGASFKTSSHLKRHQPIHSEDKPYKCQECKYETIRSNDLVRHQQIHRVGDRDRIFRCPEPQCNYAAKRNRHLKSHVKMYHGGNASRC